MKVIKTRRFRLCFKHVVITAVAVLVAVSALLELARWIASP
jgi:hypothetical protein